jgi:pectate lyase
MKKLVILLALFSVFILQTGCSSDSDPDTTPGFTGPFGSSSSSSSSSSSGGALALSCEMANTVQGFASLDNGVTGGADAGNGNYRISAVTGVQIKDALVNPAYADKPLTIYIDGLITWEDSNNSAINVRRNDVTLIGRGANAGFEDAPVLISHGASNIIIRNLVMRLVPQAHSPGDVISLDGRDGAVSNIWIDHNELYNSLTAPPGVLCEDVPGCDGNVNQDYYDELVSGRSAVHNVTISYNYLHDSWKTSLWGSSDNAGEEDVGRTITFHHNYWEDTRARLPLFRFGQGHVFNNYYFNVATSGINSRMGAQMRIDGNVFENVANPITSRDSSALGFWDVADNTFINVTPTVGDVACGASPPCNAYLLSTTTYTPPYGYAVALMPSSQTKAHVTLNAGVDNIDDCLDLPDTTELPPAEEPVVPEEPKDPPSAWNIYNADAEPTTAASVTLANASTSEFTLASTSEFFTANGDGTVTMDTTADANERSYADLTGITNTDGVYPKTFTFLARVSGDDVNRNFEFEVSFGDTTPSAVDGGRVKLIVRSDGTDRIQIDNFIDANELEASVTTAGYHIYHVAVTLTGPRTGRVDVYMDGINTPTLSGETLSGQLLNSAGDGVNRFRIGENSSSAFLGIIDWLIWTDEDAYRPSDLQGALPVGIGDITGYE